ncbi:MAG: AraC family transcriptional regulator, partial [Candidatus Binatia bacterium]
MNSDYERIATAIRFIKGNVINQPTLDETAAELGLSPFHFQRLFRRWAGVSPKRFLQFLTVEYAKELLEQSRSVLDTTYELGLSGPARLHDHFVSLEAVTPGEYKRRGAGLRIRYGVHGSPFGPMLL